MINLKREIFSSFFICLLALIGSIVKLFNVNYILLIPLFAFYVSKGRKESIIFSVMSLIVTLFNGRFDGLILVLSYILFLLIYKVCSTVFLDDVDSGVVSCFITVFILCVEKSGENINLKYSLICLSLSLLSFWIYYLFVSLSEFIDIRINDKKYRLDIKIYQSSKDEVYCGDCYDIFDINDKKYVLFSDGMYVGKEAYDISSFVLETLRDNIEYGSEISEAIDMCSSSLESKYNNEEYSTLDLFELCSNKLKLVKRGAEDSLIIRGKDILKVSGNSLPLGVDGNASERVIRIKDNDILIMYSDGLKDKYPFFEDMIRTRMYGSNLTEWLKKLISKDIEKQKDDVSILVIKFVDIS